MTSNSKQSGQEKLTDLRIVVVGKTGVGKSAAGNTILGRVEFESKLTSSSVTKECVKKSGHVDGRQVSVVDTPGLFEVEKSNDVIIKCIAECISLSSPGPHMFLVVFSLTNRFTVEDQKTVEILKKTFGAGVSMYTMVLFTHGDRLEETVEEFISGNAALAKFVRSCTSGYHVFNNKGMTDNSQVTQLLQKIDKIVALNGGGSYTNEMYKRVEKVIEEEKKKILREKEISEQNKHSEQKDMGAALQEIKECLQNLQGDVNMYMDQKDKLARETAENAGKMEAARIAKERKCIIL